MSSTNPISRTHDSFFPKIKSNLEVDEETKIKNFAKPKSGSNSSVNLIASQVRLEDVISLTMISSRLKKVLHVPNFEICVVTVINIITLRKSLCHQEK